LGKLLRYLLVIFLLFGALNGPALAGGSSPIKGGKLPALHLPIPVDLDEKAYLGLSGEGFFEIPQIKAKGVLIKVFNLYCPICQSTAATVVKLYRQIENNPDLKGKIKLIGIAVGNNHLEMEVFKQTYNIPFPMFSDEDFRINHLLGEVRTPLFIAVKMGENGSQEIVHTHLGGVTDARAFLDLMVEAYGIKTEGYLTKEAASQAHEPLPK